MPFSNLGLTPALLASLADQGFIQPTAVQSNAIPPILAGQDVLATAQTGSGKTIAYCAPLIQKLTTGQGTQRQARALVLVPTRELAVQVGELLQALAMASGQSVKVSVVFGGVSINPQMMALRGGCDLIVATPGRLIDLLEHNALRLSSVQLLVLDEADRMLDLGFSEELARILQLLPAQRQSLFFSATFPPAAQALAQALLQNPVRIDVRDAALERPAITHRAIAVDAPRRTQLLRHLINTEGWKRVLVFVASKHAAEIVADKLRKAGLQAEPFHGALSQGKRSQVLADFKASRLAVVVATDMAARGLDISQLPVVVNYDLPRSVVDYTHRTGRAGRAGEPGLAVNLISAGTHAHFKLIEKRLALPMVQEHIAGFESIETAPESPPGGGLKGVRPSKKDKLRAAAATRPAG
jgi:superfamily II DNA/RNA helicase